VGGGSEFQHGSQWDEQRRDSIKEEDEEEGV